MVSQGCHHRPMLVLIGTTHDCLVFAPIIVVAKAAAAVVAAAVAVADATIEDSAAQFDHPAAWIDLVENSAAAASVDLDEPV